MTADLPPLPSQLRYYDDFMVACSQVKELATKNTWHIQHDGRNSEIDFSWADDAYRPVLKRWVVGEFSSDSDPTSVMVYMLGLKSLVVKMRVDLIGSILTLAPHEFRSFWTAQVGPVLKVTEAKSVKSFLRCLCDLSVGHWMPGLHSYVSSLPTPTEDAYRVVRTGDCFIPSEAQRKIIDYIDDLTRQVAFTPSIAVTQTLRDACILVIAFQYAFRPGQIARVKTSDVRAFRSGAVHLDVVLSKKWKARDRIKVTRRVKRE